MTREALHIHNRRRPCLSIEEEILLSDLVEVISDLLTGSTGAF